MAYKSSRRGRFTTLGYSDMKARRPPNKSVSVLLSCKCSSTFVVPAPEIGDEIYCRIHGSVTIVEEGIEWRLRCMSCKYSRPFGTAELTCKVSATKHAIKKNHIVNVYLGSKLIQVSGESSEQLSFDALDPPPF